MPKHIRHKSTADRNLRAAERLRKSHAIDQAKAQLENANLTLARQEKLLTGPAGMQSAADQARATRDTAAG